MRHDYSNPTIPVVDTIKSLIYYHGKITADSGLTVPKTIAKMIGIIPSSADYSFHSAHRSSQGDETYWFAKIIEDSRIIAAVNIHHTEFKQALESEENRAKELAQQRVSRFAIDEFVLNYMLKRGVDIELIDRLIQMLESLKTIEYRKE